MLLRCCCDLQNCCRRITQRWLIISIFVFWKKITRYHCNECGLAPINNLEHNGRRASILEHDITALNNQCSCSAASGFNSLSKQRQVESLNHWNYYIMRKQWFLWTILARKVKMRTVQRSVKRNQSGRVFKRIEAVLSRLTFHSELNVCPWFELTKQKPSFCATNG